jgi:hypothetical protein
MTESLDAPSGEPDTPAGSAEGPLSYPDLPAAYPGAYPYPPAPYPGAYPPPPSQPYWAFTPPPTGPRNGLGIASLVIGVVALLTVWSFFGGVILGIVAASMGLAARGRVKRGEATNGGVAIAGIVLGSVAAIIELLVIAIAAVFMLTLGSPEYQRCMDQHVGDEQYCHQYYR